MDNGFKAWGAAIALSFLSTAALALDKVTFATNWLPEAEHGGFYQALADGTYAKYGLDVEIVQGGPQSNTRLMLPTGRLEFVMGGNMLQAFDMDMDELELSPRGSWKIVTSQGVTIELGRGQPETLTTLLQDFLRTLPQITSRYGRTPKSLVAADLRHKDGYALRLQGVTTTEGDPRKKP